MAAEDFEVPDFFNPDDWQDSNANAKKYRQKPVGEWIYLQSEIGEVVIPKMAKVVPVEEDGHLVVWAERIKVENGRACSRCHQIVCDCVMDMPIEDINAAHFSCPAVDQFVKWAALMAQDELGIGLIMASYNQVRSGSYLAENGQIIEDETVLEGVIEGVINQVRSNPDRCYGNVASDQHSVTGLSYVTGKPRDRVLRVTKTLQQRHGIVLENGETVRLAA